MLLVVQCAGYVLVVFFGRAGGVRVVYWGCAGGVLGVYRGLTGSVLSGVLQAYWGRAGVYWWCHQDVLKMYWGCIAGVLGACWRMVTIIPGYKFILEDSFESYRDFRVTNFILFFM